MPNYKIPSRLHEDMLRKGQEMTLRWQAYQCAEFPLTRDEIQTAVIKPHILASLRELEAGGMEGLPRRSDIYLHLDPESYPGLDRTCAVLVSVSGSGIFIPRTPYMYDSDGDYTPGRRGSEILSLDLSTLDDDRIKALVTWTNRATRARRLKLLADWMINRGLNTFTSVGHIMTNWATLKLLVPDVYPHRDWKERFANPPVRTKLYEMRDKLTDDMRKRITATDTVLCAADMLEPYKAPEDATVGMIKAWVRTDTTHAWS